MGLIFLWAVPVLPNLPLKVSQYRRNGLYLKIWSQSKIEEGGPPSLKGLARTLSTHLASSIEFVTIGTVLLECEC